MSDLTEAALSDALERFLKSFTTASGEDVYRSRISQMIATGRKSLVVDYNDIMLHNYELANLVRSDPDKCCLASEKPPTSHSAQRTPPTRRASEETSTSE